MCAQTYIYILALTYAHSQICIHLIYIYKSFFYWYIHKMLIEADAHIPNKSWVFKNENKEKKCVVEKNMKKRNQVFNI